MAPLSASLPLAPPSFLIFPVCDVDTHGRIVIVYSENACRLEHSIESTRRWMYRWMRCDLKEWRRLGGVG